MGGCQHEGLLTKEGIKQGLALPEGETITIPVCVDGFFYWDVTLGRAFFDGLFQIGPLMEIRRFEKPYMYISGIKTPIVWPQPHTGDTFLKYHEGEEKQVVLNADHAFDFWDGPVPERLDDAIYWSTAWFIATLKGGKIKEVE
jgi:hypothetical protein